MSGERLGMGLNSTEGLLETVSDWSRTDSTPTTSAYWPPHSARISMIMDIPPYISVSILNKPNYKEEERQSSQRSPPHQTDTPITIVPKKRSFDVAFLISTDDNRSRTAPQEPAPSFRSAFRKVTPDSRTPSPIDPTRTPSPQDRRTTPQDNLFHPFIFTPRLPLDEKPDKPFSSFLNPVPRTFLPSPLFGGNTIIPSGFVTTSLLPPSLAALTLPGQNICAKCNVSFRMTSDLVYHMRSHHKNDSVPQGQIRRRRDLEKLKCPVCNESFRERHHLTRHMTAHQDKAGDDLERPAVGERCRMKPCEDSREYRH